MPSAIPVPTRRALGALVAGAALAAAAPAVGQTGTTTIQVPNEVDISWQESTEGGYSNCTAVAMLRWKAVPEAIPNSTRLAHYRDTSNPGGPVSRVGREPFQWDNWVAGGTRVFTAPPGYHQVLLNNGAKSRPINLGKSDCSDFAAIYQQRYTALYTEVKVPAGTATPPVAPPAAPPSGGERRRYVPLLAAKLGTRTIRLNRIRTVIRNTPIVMSGRTRPALKRTRLLVQRRVVVRTKKRAVVRWTTIRRVRTTSTGAFRLVYRARKLGRDTIRITVPSSATRTSATSGQLRLKVVRPSRR